ARAHRIPYPAALVFINDKNFHSIKPVYKRDGVFHGHRHHDVVKPVGGHGILAIDGRAHDPRRKWIAGFGIDMVGYAPISILQKFAIASRGGNRPFLYFHDVIDYRAFPFPLPGALNPHTERRAVWLRPFYTQLSAEFYKVMPYATALQVLREHIDTISLGNPVHIQLHTRQLFYQPSPSEFDFIHTHTGLGADYGSAVGQLAWGSGPEPPKLYQGRNRDIK